MTQDEAVIYYQVLGFVVATISVTLAMSVVSARFWKEASYLKKKYYEKGARKERKRIMDSVLKWEKVYLLMYSDEYVKWFVDDVIMDIEEPRWKKSKKGL